MLEPIFSSRNETAKRHIRENDPASLSKARDAALLHRAISLAIESAFRFGRDLPVGAVTANDSWITGRYYSSDSRLDWPVMHAEVMALIDSAYNRLTSTPDTLVVTIEPCETCQDYIARVSWCGIKRVGFGIPRKEVAERGLVNPRNETASERTNRLGYSYEVFRVEDDLLHKAGGIILDHVRRDPSTGSVSVNKEGLNEALMELNVHS